MFTAMEGEFYKTASLDSGADDFTLKIASIPSLISRLRVNIRRHEQGTAKRAESEKASA
jgi:DNA-binding response OmpR family regulator